MSWINELARPDILALKAYEHASWEPSLERLHANELPWRSHGDNTLTGLNRYPEPQPRELIQRLASLYGVEPRSLLATRGSDEAIDLLVRTFCRAGEDAVLVCPPTFGMYAVAARIQGAQVVSVPLQRARNFELDEAALLAQCSARVKLVFLCSPNNPTGNLLSAESILRVAGHLERRALVVVDEAYIEFAGVESLAARVNEMPQLIVLRTLSKAYALAGARCGAVIAHPQVIDLLRKVIPPYALPHLTVEAVLTLLQGQSLAMLPMRIATLKDERTRVTASLLGLARVARVWPSAANFILVEFASPAEAADCLARARAAGLLIRDVRAQPSLDAAVRISIGTREQNERLLEALQ